MSSLLQVRMSRRRFLQLGAFAAGALISGCRLPTTPAAPAPTSAPATLLQDPAGAIPGVLSAVEEGDVWRIESPATPASVEESLLSTLIDEGWLPVERLVPPPDAAAGVFLRFWQDDGATCCALAQAEGEKTTLALSQDCEALAEARDKAGVAHWLPEEQGTWSDLPVGPFAFRHPDAWSEAVDPPHA